MKVGDRVGLLETGNDYTDTFAGQEVEIINLFESGQIGVRTYNGIVLIVNASELAPALPKKKMGRPKVNRPPSTRRPVKRLVTTEPVVRVSASLRESDVAYLETFNPANLSDAIRKLIEAHRAKFNRGDEVKVSHEGDKDDGQIGTIVEINGTRYLVQFDQGGGWYDESELQKA